MANISISDIQTNNEYLKNDDLLLCSVKDHSSKTYQSAKINGMNLKTSISMPPIRNLKTFNYHTDVTREIKSETIPWGTATNLRYVAYYTITLPVSSYVFVQGNFIVTKAYMTSAKFVDQYVSIRYTGNDNLIRFADLCPASCGYIDSDNSNIWASVQLSYWRGFAEAGTEFVLRSKPYINQSDRDAFIAGLSTATQIQENANRLEIRYWTNTQS